MEGAIIAGGGDDVAAVPEAAQPAVNADSFRLLTAKLRALKPHPPEAAPEQPPPPELQAAPLAVAEEPEAAATLPDPPEPQPPAPRDPGEEAGDTAITLLELMASATGLLPQERALAADTLLLLLPRMPAKKLNRLAERLAIMDNPPPLLVAKLIRDPRPEIMGPVLERSAQLCDGDMIAASQGQDIERLRMIARRRVLSPVLSGHLIASGEPSVVLALLRNAGAQLPHQSFARLLALAAEHPVLLAPLATRAELPAAVAFELYWSLPPELRRLMVSRFLTDSGTLGRILRIALAEDAAHGGGLPREERAVPAEALQLAVEALAGQRMDEAALRFAELAGISDGTAARILADPHGEPLAVLFKALGVSRARFLDAAERLRAVSAKLPARTADELQAVFDGLSFTKARVLLTYWDWRTRRTGPYAPAD